MANNPTNPLYWPANDWGSQWSTPRNSAARSTMVGAQAAAPVQAAWGSQWSQPSRQGGQNKLMQLAQSNRYDPSYDVNAAQDYQPGSRPPNNWIDGFPTFRPLYSYRDDIFVPPPNAAARNLGFDGMDLMDREYYRQNGPVADPQLPRMRRF